MKYHCNVHDIAGYILGLDDEPSKDTSNGIKYKIKKVFAHGHIQHFYVGQWIYCTPQNERSIIRGLFKLYTIDGIENVG